MDATSGYVAVACVLILACLRVPVGFSLVVGGSIGLVLAEGLTPASHVMISTFWETLDSFTLLAVPLFIWMGQLVNFAGIIQPFFRSLNKWVGNLPGGLAIGAVFAQTGFAAASGSSVASTATIGALTYPEMEKQGYRPSFAGAIVAAGGGLGIMLPPSIPLIIYGSISQAPVGDLFNAGVLPGLALAGAFILTILLYYAINRREVPATHPVAWQERLRAIPGLWSLTLLVIIVLGGIYSGIVTPTEASVLGVTVALVMCVFGRRLTWDAFRHSVAGAVEVTAMIAIILVGSKLLNLVLVLSGLTGRLVTWLTTLGLEPQVLMLAILGCFILLGCVLDGLAMMTLTAPILLPVVTAAGFSPVWFGIFVVLAMEMGQVHPPLGLNLYVIKGIIGDKVSLGALFVSVLPFVACELALAVLLIFQPGLLRTG